MGAVRIVWAFRWNARGVQDLNLFLLFFPAGEFSEEKGWGTGRSSESRERHFVFPLPWVPFL